MRMLLLWPWPKQYPIEFTNGEPIDQFWPEGNDARSIGASLKARLEAGEYTHLFLHYRLGSATAEAEGGFDANNAVEDVLDTLRVNPLVIAPSVEYVIVYGNYSGSREVDREVKDFIHRLMVIAAPLFRGATDDLRARIHSVNTRQLFRQPAHSPQKHSMMLYGKLIGSIACDAFKLGGVQDDPNFYFRPSNLRAQGFLDQIGHARFMGAEALNRFEIATLSAYGADEGKAEYLVDSPYRNYFQAINEHIERNKLERLFHEGQNRERAYLDEAMVLYEYAYDEVHNVYTPFTVESSNDLRKDKEQFLPLLPLLHTSAFYCEEKAWSGTVQELQTPTKKNGGSRLIRLAFVMHRLESGRFNGTLNYALIPRPGASGMPWSVDLENQAFDVLRPLVEATAIAALSPILSTSLNSAKDELEKAVRIASLSQVLSRTMSHNLGSHSLNAFATEGGMREQFERLEALIAKRTFLPGHIAGVACAPLDLSDLSKHRRELLARYNNYLRERMDFLADITTAVPAFETRTHLVQDLLKGYADNHLLTTTIAGSPNFDYRWKPALGEGKDDMLVSIPSDVLGRHAFYVILENIVRNSSKHGGHKTCVEFTIQVEKVTEPQWQRQGLVKVRITENLTDLSREGNKELVTGRNEWIDNPVIAKDTGRVREKAWGTLEMKAACAYLRRVHLEELDDDQYKSGSVDSATPPLLKAVGNAASNEPFGYEFYLLRPKLVMVCGEQRNREEVLRTVFGENATEEALMELGIGVRTLVELQDIAHGRTKEIINHAMMVFLSSTREGAQGFTEAMLLDLAAFPHEMIVVGDANDERNTFGKQVDESVELLAKGPGHEHAGLVHNASILKRSTASMTTKEWLELAAKPVNLPQGARHHWMKCWRRSLGFSFNTVPPVYAAYLNSLNDTGGDEVRYMLDVDYDAHSAFYPQAQNLLGLGDGVLVPPPADMFTLVRQRFLSPVARQVVIQRYPSALKRVMTLGWVTKGDTSGNNLIKQEDKQVWAQHHLASWTKGMAVIDERVQACAASDTYQPEASKDDPNPEAISVKDLLCMGGVFTPPADTIDLQRSDAFTEGLWKSLMDEWLCSLPPFIGYVCIHLTLLEKFSKALNASVPKVLDKMRAHLPGVRIIVVSGRGKPPELPRTELFMSYSALAQYTTQTYHRAPVLFSILAHSTRRIIPS